MAHRDSQDLTIDERRFLKQYIVLGDLGKAYRRAFPRRSKARKSAQEQGSRMMARIRKKGDLQAILEAAGLGDLRLMLELEKRLTATTVKAFSSPIGVQYSKR